MNVDELNQLPEGEENLNQNNIAPDRSDELKMDYEEGPGNDEGGNSHTESKPLVGLMGGQPKDDESGLDVSQYTGPRSKSSNQFQDPEAPFHTGPGNNEGNS